MRLHRALPSLVLGLALAFAAVALPGCVHYTGPAHAISPSTISEGDGWKRVPQMALVRQEDESDCGVAAVAMVLARWTRPTGLAEVRASAPPVGSGLRAGQVRDMLRSRGLRAFVIEGRIDDLVHEIEAGRPVVVGTGKMVSDRRARSHFEVVVAIHPARRQVVTLDPSLGWRESSYEGFESEWKLSGHTAVVALPPGEWHYADN
jgi:ABC-type bacteriocin/lantibiotic exporter with double-glycine peptidase domain